MKARFFISLITFACTVAILVFLYPEDVRHTWYENGQHILKMQGSEEAREYFARKTRHYGDPFMLFGTAWSEFTAGNNDVAASTCHHLLAESGNDHIRANCQYLLAQIAVNEGNYKDAQRFLIAAKDMYLKLEDQRNAYKTRLGLANIAIAVADYSKAAQLLDQALTHHKEWELGYYYLLRKQIASARGDYEQARRLSHRAYALYQVVGDKSGILSALNNMAMFALLTSRPEEARTYLDEALTMPQLRQNTYQKQYHTLCELLYRRCQGLPREKLTNEVAVWLERKGSPAFHQTVQFVLGFSCSNNDEKE